MLSGEGSDELFAGYRYNKNCPSEHEMQRECTRRLRLIHQFDGLRADRCLAAHGLELRVPFLDAEMVQVGMNIPPEHKMSHYIIEKYELRRAFRDENILPEEILMRSKEALSDAVGFSWVDQIKAYAEKHVTDAEFEAAKVWLFHV